MFGECEGGDVWGKAGMAGITGSAWPLALQQWGTPTLEREGRLSGPREQ